MSPELLYPKKFKLEHHKLTKQSDCYALGMVIYEVCGHSVAVELLGDGPPFRSCAVKCPIGTTGAM